jgi:hypothetical protein
MAIIAAIMTVLLVPKKSKELPTESHERKNLVSEGRTRQILRRINTPCPIVDGKNYADLQLSIR